MRTTTVLLGMVLLLLLFVPPRAAVESRPSVANAEDDFTLTEVAEGVYAAVAKSGGLASANAGFVVGDEAVLVVDTFFTPVAAEELIASIGAKTKQPIK